MGFFRFSNNYLYNSFLHVGASIVVGGPYPKLYRCPSSFLSNSHLHLIIDFSGRDSGFSITMTFSSFRPTIKSLYGKILMGARYHFCISFYSSECLASQLSFYLLHNLVFYLLCSNVSDQHQPLHR